MVMGGPGVEPEGVVRPAAARSWPRRAEVPGRSRALLRMEFATFCGVPLIQVPCQLVVGRGRRIVYRLLSWNPWQGVFLRLVERLHGRRLC